MHTVDSIKDYDFEHDMFYCEYRNAIIDAFEGYRNEDAIKVGYLNNLTVEQFYNIYIYLPF